MLAAVGIVAISERLLHLADRTGVFRRPPGADDPHQPAEDVRPPTVEGAVP